MIGHSTMTILYTIIFPAASRSVYLSASSRTSCSPPRPRYLHEHDRAMRSFFPKTRQLQIWDKPRTSSEQPPSNIASRHGKWWLCTTAKRVR